MGLPTDIAEYSFNILRSPETCWFCNSVLVWHAEPGFCFLAISATDLKLNRNNKQSASAIILALRKCLHSGKSHRETIAIWHTRCEQPEHCVGWKNFFCGARYNSGRWQQPAYVASRPYRAREGSRPVRNYLGKRYPASRQFSGFQGKVRMEATAG